MKLDAITQQCANKSERLVAFEYYTKTNLPTRNSLDFDFGGYYNGAGNTTLFPMIPISGSTSSHHQNMLFAGADHNPNLTYAQANMLIRIDYSTGGYSSYEYELNNLYDNNGGYVYNSYGLRMKQITKFDGQKSETTKLNYTTTHKGTISSGVPLGYQI